MAQLDTHMLWQLFVLFAIVVAVNNNERGKEEIKKDDSKFDRSTKTQKKPQITVFRNILQSLSKKGKRYPVIF